MLYSLYMNGRTITLASRLSAMDSKGLQDNSLMLCDYVGSREVFGICY